MAGRGRGRGRGRGLSFDVGMIGFGRGEALPAAIQQPPPLYPVSELNRTALRGSKMYRYFLYVDFTKNQEKRLQYTRPTYLHVSERFKN